MALILLGSRTQILVLLVSTGLILLLHPAQAKTMRFVPRARVPDNRLGRS